MTTQAHTHLLTSRLFPQTESPRCPVCRQALPDHLTAEDVEARLVERDVKITEALEAGIRVRLEKEHESKRKDAVAEAIAQAIPKALAEQREALDRAKVDAVNEAKAEAFKQNEKLRKKLAEAQRQVDQKNSNELGEGAEINLYDALRTAFEDDRIKRIKKGEPGADIHHEVVHNDQRVGSIVYDSKNHAAWRTSFVEKLKKDQLAADADHAILSTSAFPSGEQQLLVRDDVVVANPARVVQLVTLLREHMVRTHRLRLSTEQRDEKTRALYEFIVSERYGQLINRFDSLAADLLDVDVKEKKAHDAVWRKRGRLLKEAQKAHGDLASEIDLIVSGEYS
ncbi:MAG: DUF2130 domain-containing protein [Acidobacteria bacterium]|nr:DUF2130 domain-containing protein [Gemmatimonadota bacterium]MYF14793.1 DUF2130 domain-containing protein [Acidobacteriota bacterium]MYJ69051.1 DUF2130 domain-containing protein [Gemmatimonadota bacterium]